MGFRGLGFFRGGLGFRASFGLVAEFNGRVYRLGV